MPTLYRHPDGSLEHPLTCNCGCGGHRIDPPAMNWSPVAPATPAATVTGDEVPLPLPTNNFEKATPLLGSHDPELLIVPSLMELLANEEAEHEPTPSAASGNRYGDEETLPMVGLFSNV